jgi:hypothetical protein
MPEKLSAGFLIPESMVADMAEAIYATNPWLIARPMSWEERLARAIEQRSVRFRVRMAWFTVRYRLTTAADVLRGTHDCGDTYA